jgi:hypothetical protein
MNKQIKNTKKGGFIKDLQNYQKSQIIIKQNTQHIKQNSEVVKQNTQPMIKQNTQLVKQNIQPMIKQNTQLVKQNIQPMIKQNIQPIKQNIQPIKQNSEVVKGNSVVGFKGNSVVGVKRNSVVVKGNSEVGFKGNSVVGVKGNSEVVKRNSVVGVKGDSVVVKGNSEVGFKGNSVVGFKGDMDGLGKEKGNYTPRFVYLYKQKFLEEAVKNKNDMNGLSPLSGYEHKYSPKYWNHNKNIKNNNNCYSYAVNYKNKKYGKPQPGYFAKFNHIQNKQYKCVSFFKRILNDIPSVYLTSFKQKCKKGFHKAFFAIDSNKNEHDYHFYRQDNNQLWSHKPGTTNVINYDADYKIIKNPYSANRNYTTYNYDKPCFFFCVNNKFGKTNAHI